MSSKNALQVCIKVRPCEPGQTTLWQVKDNRALQIIDSQSEPCVFDYVFDQDSNNQIVFDCMAKHIVEACMEGFNGTIFAYGQTSSGKTYTMMGDKDNPGVMVLAAKEIFKQIARHSDRDFLLRAGYIEIYNEKIYDLLNKTNQDLKIHESNGMVHVNCEELIITCEDDLLQYLSMGNKARTVGETNMNERSSRSHAIFRIIIESRKTDRNDDDAVIQSLLNLVDLAGSERADQTGARGARLKEGGHINKSLHFLSNVIKSLAENEENKYVSFRDSKLTRILQASLGGNAFTSIICSIKPSILEESQSTINFAMRAKKIRLKPQMNEIVSDATMMKRLEREIKELKDRLDEEQRRNKSQVQVRLLEEKIKTDMLKIISSNTIADNHNKNRRRTWCPATSSQETVPEDDENALAIADSSSGKPKFSGLPKPRFYPSISNFKHNSKNVPKTINIMKSLELIDDEFKTTVDNNFGDGPDPMSRSRILIPLSLTPRVTSEQSKEMSDNDLAELKTFLKLEQNISEEWEDINKKYAAATAEVEMLQSERMFLVQRCEALQTQIDTLIQSKEAADSQLRELQQTVNRLEMENRSIVDLDFQFQSHKTKSKLREDELLLALSEKESTIDNLEKTLKELSRDVLRNSKEDQMLSMCPEIELSCESICKKCVDLERLLENYRKTTPNGDTAQSIDCQCEQLRAEIASTRAQLESVQTTYEQMTNIVAEKSELCDRLSCDMITAEEAKVLLQEKCDDLEVAQKRHEEIIAGMQAEYNVIQEKYCKLLQDYEVLEQSKAVTEELHKRLLNENESLHLEISNLKESFVQVQKTLMLQTTDQNGENKAIVDHLKEQNRELSNNLAQLETKYSEIQREYEDLSNQLIESMQDGDSLRDQCKSLQERLKLHTISEMEANVKEQRIQELLEQIAQLKNEIFKKNALIDATEGTINEMREQMTNLESALLEKSVIVNQVEIYQRQIETLEKQNAEITMVYEELQEKVKENTMNESLHMSHSTHTVISQDNDNDILRQTSESPIVKLCNLSAEVSELEAQIKLKDELIEKIQGELQELNERCISMEVQQVELQTNARQSQQLLDRQATKLNDNANYIDKLQEHNAQLLERNMKAEEQAQALQERIALMAEIEGTKEQYERRLNELQIILDDTAKKLELKEKDHKYQLELKEKDHKDQLDNVKLEYLQKIEISESEYRENLRKYNIEWEESRERYEASLDKLQKQLSASEMRCAKLCADSEAELSAANAANQKEKDELIKEKQEIESLYDASKKLVEQIQTNLNKKEHDEEKDREIITSLNNKVQQLHEKYELQIHEYEALKLEHQHSLDTLKKEKTTLEDSIAENQRLLDRLKLDLDTEQTERQQQETKVSRLSADLEAKSTEIGRLLDKVKTLNAKVVDLTTQLDQIKLEQTQQFEHKLVELESSKDELQVQLNNLLYQSKEVENANQHLTVQLKNMLNIQDLLQKERDHATLLQESNAKLQKDKVELEQKLEAKDSNIDALQQALNQQNSLATQLQDRIIVALKEANEKEVELCTQKEVVEKEVDRLNSVIKSIKGNFDSDRIQLDGKISSLIEDKRNLEEKLLTTTDILQKLQADIKNKANGSNISFESNSSITSPGAKKSVDRDDSHRKKSVNLEVELRRHKRLSVHDERRRQSYWNDYQHVSCMTEPVDNICNCSVLNQKLQECQRELFIKESMATALNIELKNHPLKEETVILKKRLQEEQARAHDEIKRLKQKNLDLITKLNSYSASVPISGTSHATSRIPPKELITRETQTESDLETTIKKLTDKLNDSLQLCRHRYNKIKDLEERLKQNEYSGTSGISSQTAGQITALKSQLESQRKEIFNLTNKYEFAKRALQMRRDELEELRQIAGNVAAASSK